jgi:hypothetical protein
MMTLIFSKGSSNETWQRNIYKKVMVAFVIEQTKNGGEASNVELFFFRIQYATSVNLNG